MTIEMMGFAIGGITIGFAAGALVGKWARDQYWREKADGEPLACSGGELFHVVRDGDFAKAQRVIEYCKT